MGTLDEANVSRILSSDYGYSSLDGVMTSFNSPYTGPGEFCASHLQGSSFPPSVGSGQQIDESFQFPGSGLEYRSIASSYTTAQMPEWPYLKDEKWVLDALEGPSSRTSNLRPTINSTSQHGSLQRHHSAPSTFFQTVADFNEEIFPEASHDPLKDDTTELLTWADNLSPIIERSSQQMDTENDNSSSSSFNGCSEQVAHQEDFSARSIISSSAQLGKTGSKLGVRSSRDPPGSKLGLIRHSSLPSTSRPFLPTIGLDDFIHPESSTVHCKTRANRGEAIHPRSIAERVRRGKISERMKKLQELVPNMDRLSNTAEMLDEAVEYVKNLQLQVQELSITVAQLQGGLVYCG